jgi:twinkle protein
MTLNLWTTSLSPGSAKAITVVEGEYDAPSAFVLLGSRYPVVSVTNAATAVNDCIRNFEYLDSFESVVVCLDADTPKIRQTELCFTLVRTPLRRIADLFKPGKVRVLTLKEGKDPNEYLKNGKG